jgi:hypothetical protein
MNKLICDSCKAVNKNGSLHCRQCGGKLVFHEESHPSKAGRWFRKLVRKVLIALFVLLALAVAGLSVLLFKTSGFPTVEPGANDAKTVDRLVENIYKPQSSSFSLTSGEATLLARKLLEKSGIKPESETRIDIFVHNDRNVVSAALYSKLFGFISSRCELGFEMRTDNEPGLKYARFGTLFLPGLLEAPAAWYFKQQAVKGDNKKLLDRVERIMPRGSSHIIVKLGKD